MKRPIMCYIFKKKMVQGLKKQCSQESDTKSNTQIQHLEGFFCHENFHFFGWDWGMLGSNNLMN